MPVQQLDFSGGTYRQTEDSIYKRGGESTIRGQDESVMTSLLQQSKEHHHSYNDVDLKTLQKFKEYAPKIELTKIVKTRKLLLEGAAKGTRTRQQIH